MGIMDIFRNVTGAGNNVGPAPANIPADPNAVLNNPTIPNGNNPKAGENAPLGLQTNNAGDKDPLAGFAELWQSDPKKDAKPLSTTVSLNIDPAKLAETAGKVDFTQALNPELVAKAAKGDAGALAAVINEAAQAGLARGTGIAAKLVETALNRQADKFMKEILPAKLKEAEVSQTLRADNPIWDNPAVKPLLNTLEAQMQTKFPQATPAEISSKAKEYLGGFASVVADANGQQIVAKTPADGTPGGKKKETDWEQYFTA